MHSIIKLILIPVSVICILSANANGQQSSEDASKNLTKYVKVKLEADLSHLSQNQKKMIPLLIEAASEMDEAFWKQAYGDPTELKQTVTSEALKKHIEINYGPWERLQENRPFISGQSAKPLGANFYPNDMSKEDFFIALIGDTPLGKKEKDPTKHAVLMHSVKERCSYPRCSDVEVEEAYNKWRNRRRKEKEEGSRILAQGTERHAEGCRRHADGARKPAE